MWGLCRVSGDQTSLVADSTYCSCSYTRDARVQGTVTLASIRFRRQLPEWVCRMLPSNILDKRFQGQPSRTTTAATFRCEAGNDNRRILSVLSNRCLLTRTYFLPQDARRQALNPAETLQDPLGKMCKPNTQQRNPIHTLRSPI